MALVKSSLSTASVASVPSTLDAASSGYTSSDRTSSPAPARTKTDVAATSVPSATVSQSAFEVNALNGVNQTLRAFIDDLLASAKLDTRAARAFFENQLCLQQTKAPADVGTWLSGVAYCAAKAQSPSVSEPLIERHFAGDATMRNLLKQPGDTLETQVEFAEHTALAQLARPAT